ncbi:E3 ubiquitin-protein ligase RNF4 isoform X1 [Mobula birostris]|uniref:E3 ubiquitin-protein ligase RNF4 isoform X1 n=1 Tax=Mobula birostris TaxID=1983395 RepID=UPI003B27CFCE
MEHSTCFSLADLSSPVNQPSSAEEQADRMQSDSCILCSDEEDGRPDGSSSLSITSAASVTQGTSLHPALRSDRFVHRRSSSGTISCPICMDGYKEDSGPQPSGCKACATGPRGNDRIWRYEAIWVSYTSPHSLSRPLLSLNARKVITHARSLPTRSSVSMSKEQKSLESFFGRGHKRPNDDDNTETAEVETAKKKKASFNRQYNESYIKYGFIASGDSHAPSPLCVICGNKLSNEAMKPSKLLRHLETKHPALKDKPVEFFERKRHEQVGQKQVLRATTSTNAAALRASYIVAGLIAKANKPFTVGEELILPAAKDMCRELLGEAAFNKMAQVSLSATTVSRRIDDIAEDIEAQLFERLNESPWYAIQVDESTDVDNKAILLVYVRYIFQDDVQEDMLCALPLTTNTTGAELFKSLNDYMSGKLDWSFCVGICTDGAAAMTGRLSGFTTRVKEVAPECQSTHCVTHREMLASRKMSPNLNSVLSDVVDVINHIKAKALNSSLFEQLCEEMDAEHKRLLLHTEVRWLSRGRTLARVFELREQLQRFLSGKKSPLAAHFSDEEWIAKLAYLCDIFNLLNELNLSLQGRMTTVFKLADKVSAFKAKLELWGQRVDRGIFDMFPTLAGVLGETEAAPSFSQLVRDHLTSLSTEFERYFPTANDPRRAKEWVRDPFVNVPGESSMSAREEDQLLELANDDGLKSMFDITSLPAFWIKVKAEYPEIATKALKTLLPFSTSYLCEAGFSAVNATKTKLRNRLDIRNPFRISLSPITPRWDRLVAGKQAQGSH